MQAVSGPEEIHKRIRAVHRRIPHVVRARPTRSRLRGMANRQIRPNESAGSGSICISPAKRRSGTPIPRAHSIRPISSR